MNINITFGIDPILTRICEACLGGGCKECWESGYIFGVGGSPVYPMPEVGSSQEHLWKRGHLKADRSFKK